MTFCGEGVALMAVGIREVADRLVGFEDALEDWEHSSVC